MATTRTPLQKWFQTVLAILCLLLAQADAQHNTMSAPTGGDTIDAEQPYTIRWSPGTPGPVFISLSYGSDQSIGNLTNSVSNSGSFTWTPDNVLAGSRNYFLAICDIKTGDCTYTYNGRFTILTSSTPSQSITTRTVTSAGTAISTVTATYTAQPSSISSPSPSPASTSNSTSTPVPDSSAGQLSTGAKIAIGVAIPVVVLAIIGLALFLLRRKRKSQSPGAETAVTWTDSKGEKQQFVELSGQHGIRKGSRGGVYELETSQILRQ